MTELATRSHDAEQAANYAQDYHLYAHLAEATLPRTVKEAAATIDAVQKIAGTISEVEGSFIASDGSLVDERDASKLKDMAAQGLDHWRLGDEERKLWEEDASLGAKAGHQQHIDEYMARDKYIQEGETNEKASFTKYAKQRLALDEKIKTYQEEQKPSDAATRVEQQNEQPVRKIPYEGKRRAPAIRRPRDIPEGAWREMSARERMNLIDSLEQRLHQSDGVSEPVIEPEHPAADSAAVDEPAMSVGGRHRGNDRAKHFSYISRHNQAVPNAAGVTEESGLPKPHESTVKVANEVDATYQGRHRADDEPNEEGLIFGVPKAEWDALSHEEKLEHLRFKQSNAEAADGRPDDISPEAWAALTEEEKQNILGIDNEQAPEPKSFRERVLNLMRKAQANLWTLSANPEKDKKRKKIAAVVVGATAVAAIAGLAYLHTKGHASAPSGGNTPPPSTGGGAGAGGHEALNTVHMSLGHHGDTIWTEVSNYATGHGVNLDEGQKQHIVGEILKSNGQTWESARHLPVGYHFDIHPEQLKEFLKTQ